MRSLIAAGAFAALLLGGSGAGASDFSFTGTFSQDDNVQEFLFTANGTSDVILRSWSYAGGTNGAGQIIAAGGFDPEQALFAASGNLLGQNGDGGCGVVAADPLTGGCWDTYLDAGVLAAGTYIATLTEFDNLPNGLTLSDGFGEQGNGDFTANFGCPDNQPAFNDVSQAPGCGRTGAWAFDILGVSGAQLPSMPVPEPASLGLFAGAMFGLGLMRRWQRR